MLKWSPSLSSMCYTAKRLHLTLMMFIVPLLPSSNARQLRRQWKKHRATLLLTCSCVLFLMSLINTITNSDLRPDSATSYRHGRDLSRLERSASVSGWWSSLLSWNDSMETRLVDPPSFKTPQCFVLPPDDENQLISEVEEMEKRKYRGCHTHVLYFGSSRLGNLLIKYSMLYAFRTKYKVNVYITNEQASHISKQFQHLSISTLPLEYKNATWHFTWYRNLNLILPCPENIGRKLSCFPDRPHEHCIVVADWPPKGGFPDFSPYITELIKEFTFSNHIENEVRAFLSHVSGAMRDVTYVGVHVRATDQNIDFVNSYKRNLPSVQYFSKAMAYFRAMYTNVLFLVATDDRKYALSIIENIHNDIIFTSGYAGRINPVIFDMATLAHCNHTVLSVGTFGFWGSLLGGGTIVAPSQYRGENTSIYDLEVKRWDRQSEWFTWS